MTRFALIFTILTACGNDTRPCPDAPPDVAVDAPIKDWRWAFTLYAEGWCEWNYKCDPASITTYYGTVERCAQDNAALCDSYLGIGECDMPYPTDRYAEIAQCETDEAALACDAYPDVPSCDLALAQ